MLKYATRISMSTQVFPRPDESPCSERFDVVNFRNQGVANAAMVSRRVKTAEIFARPPYKT